jgi:hypothetical protein
MHIMLRIIEPPDCVIFTPLCRSSCDRLNKLVLALLAATLLYPSPSSDSTLTSHSAPLPLHPLPPPPRVFIAAGPWLLQAH